MPSAIPTIDVGGLWSSDLEDRRNVAMQLRRVAMDIGFFYIRNHGISQDMLDGQLAMARCFFEIAESEKEVIHLRGSDCMRGYEGLGAQTLDADSPPDLKESFLMSRDLGPDHPYVAQNVPNYGPNQWPVLPGFKEGMEAYYTALADLELRMMRALALSLDMPEDHFDGMYDEPMSILRLLHYPPNTAATHDDQLGAGAHTDWGMLTFLLQDEIGGLEVRAVDDSWVAAPPERGSFVVNIGDMITRMTNGLYHSTMHRVKVNTAGRDRYSVVFFGEPSHFAQIDILENCIEDVPKFTACTAGEHLFEMQNKTYNHRDIATA